MRKGIGTSVRRRSDHHLELFVYLMKLLGFKFGSGVWLEILESNWIISSMNELRTFSKDLHSPCSQRRCCLKFSSIDVGACMEYREQPSIRKHTKISLCLIWTLNIFCIEISVIQRVCSSRRRKCDKLRCKAELGIFTQAFEYGESLHIHTKLSRY